MKHAMVPLVPLALVQRPKAELNFVGFFSAIYYFTLFNSLKPLSLDGNFRADDR